MMKDDDDDDDEEQQHQEVSLCNNNKAQRHYELLGAPCLLYRNYESYSFLNDDYDHHDEHHPQDHALNNHLARRRRVQARWYYPMDHRMVHQKASQEEEEHHATTVEAGGVVNGKRKAATIASAGRRGRKGKVRNNDNDGDSDDSGQSQDEDEKEQKEEGEDQQQQKQFKNAVTRKHPMAVLDSDADYLKAQSLDALRAEARLNLLQQSQYYGNQVHVDSHVVVRNHQRYDANYLPAKLRLLKSSSQQAARQRSVNDNVNDNESGAAGGNEEEESSSQQPKRGKIKSRRPVYGLTLAQTKKTHHCLLQRQDMADPAYMAPFGRQALVSEAASTTTTRSNNTESSSSSRSTEKNASAPNAPSFRKTPVIPTNNDPDSPEEFGNCLVCFACTCPRCDVVHGSNSASSNDTNNSPSWWILHPVGALQDVVRLSCILLPHGHTLAPAEIMKRSSSSRRSSSNYHTKIHTKELHIGDRIRQLVQCTTGPDKFVARTSNYCLVFEISVAPLKDPVQINEDDDIATATAECLGNLQILRLVHKIDLRRSITARRDGTMPSCRPFHVANHPKYGNAASGIDPKLAILCECDNRRERNVIQHVMVGEGGEEEDDDLRMTRHGITNLQCISTIEFTRHHPMLLWSAARSYVRPAMAVGKFSRRPTFGHGTSLFSIDLRTNRATFQWSPSAEQVMTEGLQSISGIHAHHPYRETSIYVSSVSAGKTWEIDTRMPCEVVNTWALPHACDDCDDTTPATGLHGAGTLLVHPLAQSANTSVTAEKDSIHHHLPRPVLAVGKSPGTFGIHLYQPPTRKPRFQTDAVEVASTPAVVNNALSASFAVSSIFPLPDVSDKAFTCGLAAFRVPTTTLLPNDVLQQLEPSRGCMDWTVCAVTVTNKGDVYSHALVESTATTACASSRTHANLPVGCSAIALPMDNASKIDASAVPGNEQLSLRLGNDFPPPSGTVFLPAEPLDTQIVTERKRKARHPKPMPRPPPEKACPFHNMPTGKVKVRMVYPIVMSNDPTKTRKYVELPVSHLEEARQLLSTTMDCFPPEAPPAYQEAPERSDLTTEVLEQAASSWGQQKTEDDPQTDYTMYNI